MKNNRKKWDKILSQGKYQLSFYPTMGYKIANGSFSLMVKPNGNHNFKIDYYDFLGNAKSYVGHYLDKDIQDLFNVLFAHWNEIGKKVYNSKKIKEQREQEIAFYKSKSF